MPCAMGFEKSILRYTRGAIKCWRGPGPPPWLSAWATWLRRNIAVVANRWVFDLCRAGSGIKLSPPAPIGYKLDTLTLWFVTFPVPGILILQDVVLGKFYCRRLLHKHCTKATVSVNFCIIELVHEIFL